MPSLYDHQQLDQIAGRDSRRNHALRRFRTRVFKQGWPVAEAMAELPADVRDDFEGAGSITQPLELSERIDSQLDGASKLLFRTPQGYLIEAVILRVATGRTALCVSSQVGCAANCLFCATGKMGIAKNLTAGEILDQVVQANQILRAEDRRVRNIVFMGMGEPLHNADALHQVLHALLAPELFSHSPQRLLISTVGIPDEMRRLHEAFPQVNLALSLHSADQTTREGLIPLAKSIPLTRLRETLLGLGLSNKRPVMIEYLMLAGRTDTPDAAEKLIDFLAGIPAHINLIPYNSIDGADVLKSSDTKTREQFGETLRTAGFAVTIRYSLGADIAAACGQLVQRENREIATRLHTL